ncbi:MAG: MCE family protein [Actinobacteria bacterium]|nr:MAG: MCE family protein [Actinomycetota bacterium]
MRRVIATAALLATITLVFVAQGSGGSGGSYEIRGIFDNGAFLVTGEDVRIAGAKVGSVASVDVTMPGEWANRDESPDPGKAVVVMDITDAGFQDFRQDASCIIRPASLLGEKYVDCTPTQPRAPGTKAPPPLETIPSDQPGAGQHFLPIESNGKEVDDPERPGSEPLRTRPGPAGDRQAGRSGAARDRPRACAARAPEPRAGQPRQELRSGACTARARAGEGGGLHPQRQHCRRGHGGAEGRPGSGIPEVPRRASRAPSPDGAAEAVRRPGPADVRRLRASRTQHHALDQGARSIRSRRHARAHDTGQRGAEEYGAHPEVGSNPGEDPQPGAEGAPRSHQPGRPPVLASEDRRLSEAHASPLLHDRGHQRLRQVRPLPARLADRHQLHDAGRGVPDPWRRLRHQLG